MTIEENVLAGGFGAGVVEHLADHDLHGDPASCGSACPTAT